jgi:hypothetical protein
MPDDSGLRSSEQYKQEEEGYVGEFDEDEVEGKDDYQR